LVPLLLLLLLLLPSVFLPASLALLNMPEFIPEFTPA
jgi:hypothetical protein